MKQIKFDLKTPLAGALEEACKDACVLPGISKLKNHLQKEMG